MTESYPVATIVICLGCCKAGRSGESGVAALRRLLYLQPSRGKWCGVWHGAVLCFLRGQPGGRVLLNVLYDDDLTVSFTYTVIRYVDEAATTAISDMARKTLRAMLVDVNMLLNNTTF